MPCSGLSANTTASLLPNLKDAMLSFTQALSSVCLWLHEARADGSLKEIARPVIGSVLMLWFLSAFVRAYLRYRRQVHNASSARLDTLFPTYHILSYIFQTTRWTLGGDWFWTAKYDEKYKTRGSDIITITSFFSPKPEFTCANARAVRRLNLDRQTFQSASQPTKMYSVLAFFGPNLVIEEGAGWKRHRKVVASSFKESAFPLVWKRTRSIIEEMTEHEGWKALAPGQSFVVDHIHNLTLRVALVVIAEAGFGIRLPWSDHQKNLGSQAPKGKIALGFKKGAHLAALDHRPSTPDIERQTFALDDESFDDSCATEDRRSMLQTNADDDKASKGGFWAYVKGLVGKSLSVQEALRIVALNTLPRMILPKWAFWFPLPYLWEVDRGYVALEKYMKNLVVTRRQRILDGTDFEEVEDFDCDAGRRKGSEVKRDLFGSLVRSALECGEKDGAGQTLSDEEVVGNVFIFLLAGHETTANSLAFTMANLALHPEAQDKLYEEIIQVCGKDGEPSYADYHKLVYTLACYNESIRLFPPVNLLPKVAMVDTTLRASLESADGVTREEDVFVPEGSLVMIDVVGLHYNPRYWGEDVKEYRPERFLEQYDKDAFVPFSSGPRACIGRRFTEVESVCALVHLIRRFKIKPIAQTGETLAQVKERIMAAKQVITLTPLHCPLSFEAR